jgi:hypothetical protein
MFALNVAGTHVSKEPDILKFTCETLKFAFFREKAHPLLLFGQASVGCNLKILQKYFCSPSG